MEKGEKVLFVDDEVPILNTLKRVFYKANFESIFIESGEEALKVLDNTEISVIVTDFRMPDLDGLSLLKIVKEKHPDVIRVILTAYPDLAMLLDAVNEVGIFRIILKPWRNEELKHAIQQALEHRRLMLENRRLIELTTRQNKELKEINSRLLDMVEEKTKEWLEIKEKLIQMDKLSILGFMTGVVAHELNNPLTAILAITEMVLRNLNKQSEIYRDMKEIESAAERCREIVNRYLRFTRVSRDVEFTTLSIRDVIKNAVSMMRPMLAKKNIEIEILMDEIPLIRGSFNRLLQVFLNLIRNSLDAMDRGGKISITAERYKDGIKINVSDTGPGIPAEVRDKIFFPFFTTKKDGTGLGLSIVDGIVKEHGGKIELNQSNEEGTIFSIYLPGCEQPYAEKQSANN